MTLILCQRSPLWVAIAADRMLSIPPSGIPVPIKAVKLVQFYNEAVFGCTGYGGLLNDKGQWVPTDRWLVDVLVSGGTRSLEKALVCIAESATRSFRLMERRQSGASKVRQAFLAVGWVRVQEAGDAVLPAVAFISNYHGSDGSELASTAKEFGVLGNALETSGIMMHSVGQAQSLKEIAWMQSQLEQSAHNMQNAMHFVHLMKQSIRQTSKRLNGRYVGKDVLALVIPRSAAFYEDICVLGPRGGCGYAFQNVPERQVPIENCSFFFRFREGSDLGTYESPHVVCPGFSAVSLLFSHDGGSSNFTMGFVRDSAGKVAGVLSTKAVTAKKGSRSQRRRSKRANRPS